MASLSPAGHGRTPASMADRATASPAPPPPASEQFAELVVVRHGETEWNSSHIIQGQLDPELNETGKRQALLVARRLAREAKPAAVYSSDLRRAAVTAQAIATACGVSDVVVDRALRERHMGDLHGLTFHDAVRMNPQVFSPDRRNQEIPGGGESLDQLTQRCVAYLSAVAAKHMGDRVIVVTHGAAMEELCAHVDPTCPVRGRLRNTCICVFRVSGGGGGGGSEWILEKASDVAHLREGAFLEDAVSGDGGGGATA